MRRHPNVVNVAELPWNDERGGEKYAWKRRSVALAAGGRKIGCSFYSQPPGKGSFPYHFHHANEEAIFVLGGEGTLRLAGQEVPLKAGDYVALPAGPEGAHALFNSGPGNLEFLCLSTMEEPDLSEYPDAGKIGVFSGAAPGRPREEFRQLAFFTRSETIDYWTEVAQDTP